MSNLRQDEQSDKHDTAADDPSQRADLVINRRDDAGVTVRAGGVHWMVAVLHGTHDDRGRRHHHCGRRRRRCCSNHTRKRTQLYRGTHCTSANATAWLIPSLRTRPSTIGYFSV